MKQFIYRFIVIIMFLGQYTFIQAQSTTDIPYQGVARTAAGTIVANQLITIRLTILEGSPTGPVFNQQTLSATTNSLGLFNVKMTGPGVFNPAAWEKIAGLGAFLKTELDINGGSVFVDMGTTQLMSAPFALYAQHAGGGSVVYKGTWDADTNTPDLGAIAGTKGFYYVVSNAGSHSLSGESDWQVGDWAISNGTVWQKIDNSQSPVSADATAFTATGHITATNVQGAIDELDNLAHDPNHITQDATHRFVSDTEKSTWNGKQAALGFTPVPESRTINGHSLNSDVTVTKSDVGLGNVANLDFTVPSNITQDATHRFATDAEKASWNGKQNALGFTPVPESRTINGHSLNSDVTVTKSDVGLGNVTNLDFSNPSNITQDATHRFVSDTEKAVWNGKLNLTGGTMSGDLILNASPATALGAATKQYVDDNSGTIVTSVAAKVNRAGDTMTGALVLNADPVTALGAATKQYVDDHTGALATSVTAKVNRAGDTMTGALVLNADPTAALGAATKQYVDDHTGPLATSITAKVNRSGDTMTGALVLNADPVAALGAVTKQYTDAGLSAKLNLTGGTLSGDLVLNANPTVALGASTKQYVDATASAKLDLAGGTMTGDLVLNANPTVALGAATKQYVDAGFDGLIDSYIHKTDDGITVYLPAGETRKRIGIGDTEPTSPLGIVADGTEKRVLTLKPNNLTPGTGYTFKLTGTGGNPGLDLEQESSSLGSVSRLFIQESDGYVGMGTTTPNQKLHIEESTGNGVTGIRILNTATAANNGFVIGHSQSIDGHDGAFSIMENGSSERFTIRTGGNIGINELIPDTKLHVSRPVSDPNSAISLLPGTGIITVGPMTDNIVADYRGIQARTGAYIGPVLSMSVSELNLQRLGGEILIHGDMDIASRTIITSDGKLGLGRVTPVEKLDVNGAIKIGTTTNSNEGTIRFTGTDFEGRKGGAWVSLTTHTNTDGFTTAGTGAISYSPPNAKVGIGISVPTSALHVEDNSVVSSGSTGALIVNKSSTSSGGLDDNRVGLQIQNSTTWSSNADAKNIGLYVSDVTGQSKASSNIGALINGNVVVGSISSPQLVGTGGSRVLVIQNGTAPTTAVDGSVQVYSADYSAGVVSPPSSVFHVRNGNGDIIKLYKEAGLTAADNTIISSTTYSPEAQAVINNMRNRLNQLEAKLIAIGLLNDPL